MFCFYFKHKTAAILMAAFNLSIGIFGTITFAVRVQCQLCLLLRDDISEDYMIFSIFHLIASIPLMSALIWVRSLKVCSNQTTKWTGLLMLMLFIIILMHRNKKEDGGRTGFTKWDKLWCYGSSFCNFVKLGKFDFEEERPVLILIYEVLHISTLAAFLTHSVIYVPMGRTFYAICLSSCFMIYCMYCVYLFYLELKLKKRSHLGMVYCIEAVYFCNSNIQ